MKPAALRKRTKGDFPGVMMQTRRAVMASGIGADVSAVIDGEVSTSDQTLIFYR